MSAKVSFLPVDVSIAVDALQLSHFTRLLLDLSSTTPTVLCPFVVVVCVICVNYCTARFPFWLRFRGLYLEVLGIRVKWLGVCKLELKISKNIPGPYHTMYFLLRDGNGTTRFWRNTNWRQTDNKKVLGRKYCFLLVKPCGRRAGADKAS